MCVVVDEQVVCHASNRLGALHGGTLQMGNVPSQTAYKPLQLSFLK